VNSDSLSQQEIDLLFGGAPSEPHRPVARAPQADVQVYDFRRPSRISKDRQRTLEGMYALLTKSLESWLVGRVRSQVEVQLLGVEQFSFGEFLLSLSAPCTSYIFEINDTGGQQGLIDFGRDFGFYLVDRLLGGKDRIEVLDRALSPLERLIVRTVAERVMELLVEVWQDHVRLDFELSRFEMVPDMIQIVNREDPVLVANMEVSAENFRSLVLICLPFAVLEKFFTDNTSRRVTWAPGGDRERAVDRVAVEQSLRATALDVSVRFPPIPISMRDLAALRPGSVLETGLPVDSELDLLIAGEPRFRVAAGRVGQSLAVRIQGEGSGELGPASAGMREVATNPTDGGLDQ
jgi:flagellar motor switch protein FliM